MISWNQSDNKKHHDFNNLYIIYKHPIIITIISITLSNDFSHIYIDQIYRSNRETKEVQLKTGETGNRIDIQSLSSTRCSPSPPLHAKNPGEIPLQAKLNCQLTVVRHRDRLHACFKARTRRGLGARPEKHHSDCSVSGCKSPRIEAIRFEDR